MQTFMPYPDFQKSVKCLDWRRLGKQRVEAYQIMKVLCGLSDGWKRHPAVRMWHGHSDSLWNYAVICCQEWRQLGYRDTVLDKLLELEPTKFTKNLPSWLGNEHFHASHRSNLLRKDPIWYGNYGWTEKPDLPYFWPNS